ncbi:MAG: hypothetical protein LBE37_14095 [Sphingobacterium sp.]|jgi:chemotaxis protein histidine kinase CheA|nr:hypothetical protein [Sphingobacterium sp.]
MNSLFIASHEVLVIIVALFYLCVIAAIFWGVYKILTILQNRHLAAKREHTAALLIQSDALNEIAAAIRESNDKNGTPPEII